MSSSEHNHLPGYPHGWELIIVVLVVALLLSIFVSCATQTQSPLQDWRYYKPIALPSNLDASKLAQLPLDTETSYGSSKGLDDLQILDSSGSVIPYALVVDAGSVQDNQVTSTIKGEGYIVGSYTTFIADLGTEGVNHNQIVLNIPNTNFSNKATVETSNDGTTWTQVAEETIYDYSIKQDSFSTRDVTIKYPESTARYVRVNIYNSDQGPLTANGGTISLDTEKAPIEISWPVDNFTTSQDAKNQSTDLVIDMGSNGIPTSHIYLTTNDSNFNRKISIEASDDKASWRPISTATIFGYATSLFTGSSLDFTYPETSSRYIRLVIHNGSNPPLNITGLKISGNQRTLVFQPNQGSSYKLYYGNPNVRQSGADPNLDVSGQNIQSLPASHLGSQSNNPMYVNNSQAEGKKYLWVIPVAIFAATFLAAAVLFLITRKPSGKNA